jgi:hypothetical protein
MSDNKIYIVELSKRNCRVSVDVNDIPCLKLFNPDFHAGARPVNDFLGDGPITINFEIHPLSDVFDEHAAEACEARMLFSAYRRGALPGDGSGELIWEISYPPPDIEEIPDLPALATVELAPVEGREARLWELAEPIPDLDAVRASALAYIQAVGRAFFAGETGKLAAAYRPLHDDLDKAYAMSAGFHAGGFPSSCPTASALAGMKQGPLSDEVFSPQLIANGRLVKIQNIYGKSMIYAEKSNGEGVELPLCIGLINNKWRILM